MLVQSTNAFHTNWEINKPVTNLFGPNESILPDWLISITTPTGYPVASPELSTITEVDDVEIEEVLI
jgi:hypothetical protein